MACVRSTRDSALALPKRSAIMALTMHSVVDPRETRRGVERNRGLRAVISRQCWCALFYRSVESDDSRPWIADSTKMTKRRHFT